MVRFAFLIIGLLAGVFFQRFASRPAAATVATIDPEPSGATVCVDTLRSPAAAPRVKPARAAPAPGVQSAVNERDVPDEAARKQERVRASRDLVRLLLGHVKGLEGPQESSTPERIANEAWIYQKGVLDTLVRTAPELFEELSSDITQMLCDAQTRTSQKIALSYAVAHIPELASEDTFTCIFERGEEDIVLWTALDAWRAAQLPRTPALEEVAREATDPRTQRRLAEGDEDSMAASKIVERAELHPSPGLLEHELFELLQGE